MYFIKNHEGVFEGMISMIFIKCQLMVYIFNMNIVFLYKKYNLALSKINKSV